MNNDRWFFGHENERPFLHKDTIGIAGGVLVQKHFEEQGFGT